MKTNKSFLKRLKVTPSGKVRSRKPGKNHFNAKASGRNQLADKRTIPFTIKPKMASYVLPARKITNR